MLEHATISYSGRRAGFGGEILLSEILSEFPYAQLRDGVIRFAVGSCVAEASICRLEY